jgi:hypothetical protein
MALITLTILSYGIDISLTPSHSLRTILVGLGLIKFLLILFNFMQIRQSHLFWKVLALIYTVVFIISAQIASAIN